MTSDKIKQVREAADIVLGRFGCHRADCRDCAKFAMSLVGTDGELPVTEEWLEKQYSFKYSDDDEAWCIDVDEMKYEMHKRRDNVWSLYWDETESWPHDIHCCFQFRLLATALGITKKGES